MAVEGSLRPGAQAAHLSLNMKLLGHNPFHSEEESSQWSDVFRNSALSGKIELIEERLPAHRDVAALMARADCGVFPFRAEGWNLDLAEMMAMGKPLLTVRTCGG